MALRISSSKFNGFSAAAPRPGDDLDVLEPRWFAVRTSARHEKKAAGQLTKFGVECYVPLRERQYQYRSKQVTRQLPLVTGYVFVRIVRQQEQRIYETHYTRGYVRIGRRRIQITQAEIDLLAKLSTDRELEWETVEEAFAYEDGTPVEIIKGPLAGVKGHYVERKNKKTFIIALSGLGALLSTCEIDPLWLSPLHGEPLAPRATPGSEGKSTHW